MKVFISFSPVSCRMSSRVTCSQKSHGNLQHTAVSGMIREYRKSHSGFLIIVYILSTCQLHLVIQIVLFVKHSENLFFWNLYYGFPSTHWLTDSGNSAIWYKNLIFSKIGIWWKDGSYQEILRNKKIKWHYNSPTNPFPVTAQKMFKIFGFIFRCESTLSVSLSH